MPNFTKGKWRIADYIGVGWDIVDERGINIAAQVCEDDDARLIVAAPEMYALLNQAFRVLSDNDFDEALRLRIDECLSRIESCPLPGLPDEEEY